MWMRGLKSFEEARRCAGALNRLPPRVVPIALRSVVGGVDRAKLGALRRDFLPRRHGAQELRYLSVHAAMRAGTPLPAIEVCGLGGEYYVVDGHHRVAAARALGRLYIDALVHEFLAPATAAGTPAPNGQGPATWGGDAPRTMCGSLLARLRLGIRLGALRTRTIAPQIITCERHTAEPWQHVAGDDDRGTRTNALTRWSALVGDDRAVPDTGVDDTSTPLYLADRVRVSSREARLGHAQGWMLEKEHVHA